MPNLTNLHLNDYMALTRAMDQNGNHRVDGNEARIGWNAQSQIGNQNGVAGTRELATALEKGDVFMNSLGPATADKVAEYFSKHKENFNKPVSEWVSDAWISKEDFDFEPAVRQLVDKNGDNRISKQEFASALASGALTIGASRQISQNPFQNPFQGNKPATPNYGGGVKPPTYGSDTKPASPYSPTPDSGAYLQIEMARGMRSDYEKGQIFEKLAGQKNLSPREQVMLIDALSTVSSDYTKQQILTRLAQNNSLHEDGVIKLAKAAREIRSEYTKSELLGTLMKNQSLSPQAQQSVIISIGTIDSDYTMSQSLLSLIRTRQLTPENKELLLRTAQEKISSDYTKREILDALF